MWNLARLQLMGPLLLLCAAIAADASAYALALKPSSPFLWYLNLEVFSFFRKSRILFGEYGGLPYVHIILMCGPLAVLALAGWLWKRSLLTAVACNLSFVYTIGLLYGWHHWNARGSVSTASLTNVQVPDGADFYIFGVILMASLLSFVVSHVWYWRRMRQAT